MPFYLKPRDIFSDTAAIRSALLVPCRFCPAASLAVRENQPYLRPLHNLLRTPSYEAHIHAVKFRLESRGIRTDVFDTRAPHQFVMCMWTKGRRAALARRAAGHDAAIVLGCDAAVETVRSCVGASDCRVVPGMEVEGVMNVMPAVRFPLDIRLELKGVIRATLGREATPASV